MNPVDREQLTYFTTTSPVSFLLGNLYDLKSRIKSSKPSVSEFSHHSCTQMTKCEYESGITLQRIDATFSESGDECWTGQYWNGHLDRRDAFNSCLPTGTSCSSEWNGKSLMCASCPAHPKNAKQEDALRTIIPNVFSEERRLE